MENHARLNTCVTFLTILKLIPKLNLNQTLNRKPSFGEKMKIIRSLTRFIFDLTVIGLFSLDEKSFEKESKISRYFRRIARCIKI